MKLPTLTNREKFISLVAIVACILLGIMWCNKGGKSDAAKEIIDTSDVKYKAAQDSIKSLTEEKAVMQGQYFFVVKKLSEVTDLRNATQKQLEKSDAKAFQLANKVRELTSLTFDTSQYNQPIYQLCDSLAIEVQSSHWVIGNLQTQIEQQDELQRQKDSANKALLDNQKSQTDIALQCCNVQKGLVDKLYKTTKPKGSLWVGGRFQYTPENPVSQAGGALGYMSKGGKFYLVDLGLQNKASWYAGGTILIKLGKR